MLEKSLLWARYLWSPLSLPWRIALRSGNYTCVKASCKVLEPVWLVFYFQVHNLTMVSNDAALLVLAAVITASHHFPNNTGRVVTLIGAGTNLGALLFTIIYNNLGKSVSSAWRNRIIGLILVPMYAFMLCFLSPPNHLRIPSTKKLRLRDVYPKLSCLKDPALRYLAMSKSLAFFASWVRVPYHIRDYSLLLSV